MKQILLSASILLMALASKAQWVYDTVDLGPNLTQDVYYSMANGAVKAVDNKNWILGLSTKAMTAGIFVNHVAGVRAFNTHKDSSNWATITLADTAAAPALNNPDTSWTFGALNTNKGSNVFDFGWGNYDFASKNVFGDSIYIIAAGANYYKLHVIKMSGVNDYTIKVGGVGSPVPTVTYTFNKSPKYDSSNLIYVSAGMAGLKDTTREPNNSTWDLVFANYNAYQPTVNPPAYYLSAGALSNSGVEVAQITGFSKDAAAANYNQSMLKKEINEIGFDWKTFTGTTFVVDTNNSYVVKAHDGGLYQIAFTYYSGKATGKIAFATQPLNGALAVNDITSNAIAYGVYPNPTKSATLFTLESKTTQNAQLVITDINGKMISKNEIAIRSGLNAYNLPTENIANGTYLISVKSDNININTTLIKQ